MKIPTKRRLAWWSLLGLAVFGSGFVPQAAQAQSAEELKAAFVHRLCQFVSWPTEETDAPFLILVVGHSPVRQRLEELTKGKAVNGRPVVVEQVSRLQDLAPADVVFVAEGYRRWSERILSEYRETPTLTIGDFEDFANRGGGVSLYFRGDRLALKINYTAAVSSGLSFNPKLLTVADQVFGRP